MKCTDPQFTNKHLLKQFMRAQDYFQDLEDSNNLTQVMTDVANEMEIKFYKRGQFLFHYDKEEFYDWFILLKGKISLYQPKPQQEIGYEMNLLKQREVIKVQIEEAQSQPQTNQNKENLRNLQLKRQYVEDTISKICSSQYDYIFQKYPSSYYKQHPQILCFKLTGVASDGYVFDQIHSEQPLSAFVDEDTIVGYLKNQQYLNIFQNLSGNKQIITKALKKIQQRQDSVFYMKQVKEQHSVNSQKLSELKSISQDRTSRGQNEVCDDFQTFIENMPKEQSSKFQKETSASPSNSPNEKGGRTNSNFEINLQKEVKEILKRQSSYKFGGPVEAAEGRESEASQKKREILSNISNSSSPQQYQIKDTSPVVRAWEPTLRSKSNPMRGNFLELINSQKLEIEKKSFLVSQQQQQSQQYQQQPSELPDKSRSDSPLVSPIRRGSSGLINLQKVQSSLSDRNNKPTNSPPKSVNFQINFLEGNQEEEEHYRRQLDELISKELSQTNKIFENDIVEDKNQNQNLEGTRKQSSSCHQKKQHNQFSLTSTLKQSERQRKNDGFISKSSNFNNRSGSVGDIFQKSTVTEETKLRGELKNKSNYRNKDANTLKSKQESNQINLFAFGKDPSDVVSQGNQQDRVIQNDNIDGNQTLIKKLNKEEIKNMYPHIFQKARVLYSQQQQKSQLQTRSEQKQKSKGIDIESTEEGFQQTYLLQGTSTYSQRGQPSKQTINQNTNKNQTDQVSSTLSHILNLDLMSTLQSSQDAINAKIALQASGQSFFQKSFSGQKMSNNQSTLRDIIQTNQSLVSSLSSGWSQFNISPNLLEKRKNYADNLRNQHKKCLGRNNSQPNLVSNISPNNSITNSPPNSSCKSIRKSIPQQKLSFSSALQYQSSQPPTQATPNRQLNSQASKSQNPSNQNSMTDIPLESYKKQINSSKNHQEISSTSPIKQSNKLIVQRSSSSLGFQQNQPRSELQKVQGFKGKKISSNSKYSFISAYPNGSNSNNNNNSGCQIQNNDIRRKTPNNSLVHQGRNSIDEGSEDIYYQANDSMRVSIAKDGIIKLTPAQQTNNNPQQTNDGVAEQKNKMFSRQNSASSLNKMQSPVNSMKAMGIELNKQVQQQQQQQQQHQQQQMQKSIVYSKINSSRQPSLGQIQQVQNTQSQLHKDVMKNKIIKGSLVSKLTPEQSSLIAQISSNPSSSSVKENSKKQSLNNQLQDNSIRQEILNSLQRKIDSQRNPIIKLQSCSEIVSKTQNTLVDEQNGDIFSDTKIRDQQQMNLTQQDFKHSNQKPVLVSQMVALGQQPKIKVPFLLQQGKQRNDVSAQRRDDIDAEELEEFKLDRHKDEHYLLRLIQERDNDSLENYIGFQDEILNNQEIQHNQTDDILPRFGIKRGNSSSSNLEKQIDLKNNSFGTFDQVRNESKGEEEEEFYTLKSNMVQENELQKSKPLPNTDGGSRHKSILKKKQSQNENDQNFDLLNAPEQVTLGHTSNEDFFNVSNDHIGYNTNAGNYISSLGFSEHEIELNTQTFQKRKRSSIINSHKDIAKLITISETPKFTFQLH